jgi:hypothetical protein
VESWWDGHWISEKTAATAEAAEKSVEFSSSQKPAEAETSFGIEEAKSGSCLQNAGFVSFMGYRLEKAFISISTVEDGCRGGESLEQAFEGPRQAAMLCHPLDPKQERGGECNGPPPQPDANEPRESLRLRKHLREQHRQGRLERAIAPNRCHYGDAGVKEDADGSDHHDDFCNGNVQIPEVDCKSNAEKEEGKLQHDGQGLHGQVEPPLLESHKLDLTLPPTFDDAPPRRDPGVIQDPLFAQHRDERHEECDAQAGEEDGLSSDDTDGYARDWRQGVGPAERGVLLQYSEEQNVCEIDRVWLELGNDLNDEGSGDRRE